MDDAAPLIPTADSNVAGEYVGMLAAPLYSPTGRKYVHKFSSSTCHERIDFHA
jgi:hypothetical protein